MVWSAVPVPLSSPRHDGRLDMEIGIYGLGRMGAAFLGSSLAQMAFGFATSLRPLREIHKRQAGSAANELGPVGSRRGVHNVHNR